MRVFIRTTTMEKTHNKRLSPEERLDKAVSWLRTIIRGCTDIKKQLRSITTVCAKWDADRVKARDALKDILYEPRTEEELLYASDLWLREKVIVPRKKMKKGCV